jgi:hypothetical protein
MKGGHNLANPDTNISDIDWMACELIEKFQARYRTIDELREGFPSLSVSQIQRLIEFAHAQRGQTNP